MPDRHDDQQLVRSVNSKYEYKYDHGLILKNVTPNDSGILLIYDQTENSTTAIKVFLIWVREVHPHRAYIIST